MKTKLLSFLVAGCLLGLAAWFVCRNNNSLVMSPNAVVPTVQGGEPNTPEPDKFPEEHRDTVHKGLAFLVKHQHQDGHWEGDEGKQPVAMTGLVGLALLMDREVITNGDKSLSIYDTRYGRSVGTAADWLIEMSHGNREGPIFSEHASETTRYMQGHGLATLFLAGVCIRERDAARRKKLTEVLTRAVTYIVKAQSTQGGWYHTSKVEGHDFAEISTTVIQIQALQAAENAGVPVPDEAIGHGQEYVRTAMAKYEKRAEPSHARSAETAGALACRSQLSWRNKPEDVADKWLKYCQTAIPMGHEIKLGHDERIHYYYAQSLFNQGDDSWKSYGKSLFDFLKIKQNNDGSWPSAEGNSDGPVYSTAVWCTVLQLDKGSHPARQVREARR